MYDWSGLYSNDTLERQYSKNNRFKTEPIIEKNIDILDKPFDGLQLYIDKNFKEKK